MYKQEPKIHVGIVKAPEVSFELNKNYTNEQTNYAGKATASLNNNQVVVTFQSGEILTGKEIYFSATKEATLTIYDVVIGIDFHWEQKEIQGFEGDLRLIIEDGEVRAVNVVPIERYLSSVISSEMRATSAPSLLRSHAVVSRSWLLSQIEKSKRITDSDKTYVSTIETEGERIRWYDREDHVDFDVCADDHCQRYQGITKVISPEVEAAIQDTYGLTLMANGEICDARFSKCCGGFSEVFDTCWEEASADYLHGIWDTKNNSENIPDLTVEAQADQWIRTSPEAFCNTTNKNVLSQVLNEYDQTTTDFYRWTVEYTQEELSALIKKRSGIDFGDILALEPIARGVSGRLFKLKIVGSKKTLTIGKELEIRKFLSESHLYSSAFVVDAIGTKNNMPTKFKLTGAGWGHGVGLCQIGAALMADEGYSYGDILNHYFKDVEQEKLYDAQ